MPFKSKSQSRFMFAKHPDLAKEFAAKTLSIKKLPERIKKGVKNIANSFKKKDNSSTYDGIPFTQSKTMAVEKGTGRVASEMAKMGEKVSTRTHDLEDHYFIMDKEKKWRDVGIYDPNKVSR